MSIHGMTRAELLALPLKESPKVVTGPGLTITIVIMDNEQQAWSCWEDAEGSYREECEPPSPPITDYSIPVAE